MKKKFSFENKTAVITGGASGIGKSMVKTFAIQGCEIHILDIDESLGRSLVNEIHKMGFKTFYHQCDVTNFKEVSKSIVDIEKMSKIDILINNAGVAHVGNIENCSEKDFDKLYEINVKGVYNCTKASIPGMKINGGGVILNMASVASSVGVSDRFAYSMTKGAVLAMTNSIAKDYLTNNIRCNAISPARIHTPFVDGFIKKNYPGNEKEIFKKLSQSQPIGRMGKSNEVADLALFLCSDEASFITGSNYGIDGGYVTLNSK